MRLWNTLLGMLLCLCVSQSLHAQAVLLAHPGPTDNGGGIGSAMFFDLQAQTPVVVTGFTTAVDAAAGETVTVRVSIRSGTALGGTLATGPGASSAGWRLLGTFSSTQGTASVSLPIGLPDIPISPGEVVGVAVEFIDRFPAYVGTGAPPISTYSNANLILRTGEARSIPFTSGGSLFSSRAMVGSILYRSGDAVLATNPGPSNNAAAPGAAIFFDVEASTGVVLTGLTTASEALPGANFNLRIRTRAGSALGGPVGSGPGSSQAGWTVLGTVTATQGSSGEVSLPITIPEVRVAAGQVLGVAIEFIDIGPRYFGLATPPLETYSNLDLSLRTGEARTAPFTAVGNYFSSRALIGSLQYRLDDAVLPAHPGPSNNSGAPTSGLFFDLSSSTGAVVNGLTIASDTPGIGSFQIEVYTRSGTALGNSLGSGPATSSSGWTLRGTVNARQGPGEVSLPITLPDLQVSPGQTLGVGLRFLGAGPRYFGSGSPPQETYASPGLTLVTGQAMTTPFTATSAVFGSRALIGSLRWRPRGERLSASPGPADNGGSPGFGLFMDLHAQSDLVVSGLNTATQASPNANFQLQVYRRNGSTLGGSVTTGPSSSSAGWTLHATVTGRQAASGRLSLPIAIPDLPMLAGQTVGLALVFVDVTPSYIGSGSSAASTYSAGGLQLTTGEARGAPFTTGGSFFASRRLVGNVFYERSPGIFGNGFE
ncbi:MAG: hypothetical protein H4O13_03555 [Xanthomonadales bacterium]|nr:hypothetical protein [Xanthomonadales bacterium]